MRRCRPNAATTSTSPISCSVLPDLLLLWLTDVLPSPRLNESGAAEGIVEVPLKKTRLGYLAGSGTRWKSGAMGEPVRRKATYDDVLAAPEHVIAEVIDG